MHAEPGCTMERRNGTRAATTPRKLPTARPGTKTRGRTKSISPVIDIPAAALERWAASAAVREVPRRVDVEVLRGTLDRDGEDVDVGEGALELLAGHDRLRAGDERALRCRPLTGVDLVIGVEPALEGCLRRAYDDALAGGHAGLRSLVVGEEDEDLLVGVPRARGPVAVRIGRIHHGAQLHARDVDRSRDVDDAVAGDGRRAAPPAGICD